MTYTIQSPADITYTEVGGQLYEVPSNCPTELMDDPDCQSADSQELVFAMNDIFRASPNLVYTWDWGTIQRCPEVFKSLSTTVVALACKLGCWDLPDEF